MSYTNKQIVKRRILLVVLCKHDTWSALDADCTVMLQINIFYPQTDAQVNCLKNNIKIYINTALTCFLCSHTIIRERITHACTP